MKLKIGTRPSRLAIAQAKEVMRRFPEVGFEIHIIETPGDRDRNTPLSTVEATDFFTADIEKALLDGMIDIAVHSAKDLEDYPPPGLVIAAQTLSISPLEALVSTGNLRLSQLPDGAIVGVSSQRRKSAILRLNGRLRLKDIRGNIDERLNRLDKGLFDAIIVAHAALLRLGYKNRIAEVIPSEIIEPHPLQGRLSVQVREDRGELIGLFRRIHEA